MSDVDVAALLAPGSIRLDEHVSDKLEAVRRCGEVLVEAGLVAPGYVPAMLEREATVSTYIAEGVAIPHATTAGKEHVLADGLCFLRFPDGVDWDGEVATVAIGIAAQGDGHVAVLGQLAEILLDPERAAALRTAEDASSVLRMLRTTTEGES